MLTRVFALATLILVLSAVILWPERIRWNAGGSAAVLHQRLDDHGIVPIRIASDAVIVIEGDSLVAGKRGKAGDPIPTRMQHLLGGPRIINRGRGGQTAAEGEQFWRDAPCADLAVLLYGANDAQVRGWWHKGEATPVPQYMLAMADIIARHRRCNASVIIIAPLAPGSDAMEKRIAPYREAARRVAQAEGVAFVDPVVAWKDTAAPLQRDGLHLSDEGRSALARYLAGLITVGTPLP